jgi:glycosyltransferase involved in cell wall biosynthesis
MEINFYLNDPLRFSLLITFAVIAIIQLFYFWAFFSRLAFYRHKNIESQQPPVSVIITSHSELNFLGNNLPFILQQDYPKFEVVVVNDNSDDDTSDFLTQLSLETPNLQVVELKQSLNWFKGKKFPLSIGIKSAKYDFVVLTDADCHPVSSSWLNEIVSTCKPNTEIVLGYSTFATTSKINRLLRFAAFYDALFFLSMALSGMPFKGNGKNLSYKRQLFYRQKGFISHYIIKAGDDELFVNRAAKKRNTEVMISRGSRIISQKPISFGGWLKKEKTRLSLRRHFRFSHRFLLSLFALTGLLFYGLFATLLVLGVSWIILVPVLLLRVISQWVLFGQGLKKLSENGLWFLSPFFEMFIMLVDFILWFIILFTKKNKWT